jgi:hypothetical protein
MILRSGLVLESRPAAEPNMPEDTRSTQVEVGTPAATR